MSQRAVRLLLLLTILGPLTFAARAANTPAPTLTVQDLGDATATLGGPWQFHLGDDPAWSSPTFNDSAWEQLSVNKTWGAQTHPGYTGFGWYRRHIDFAPVPGAQPDLALFLPRIDDAYEIYWNGHLIGGYGKLPPHSVYYFNPPPFTLGLGKVRSGVLAIRVWKGPLGSFDPADLGGIAAPPLAGSPAAITGRKAIYDHTFLRNHTYTFALDFLYTIVFLLGMLAWLRNRDQPVLLWIALFSSAPVLITLLLGLHLPLSHDFALGWAQPCFSLADISTWYLLLYLLQMDGNARLRRWTKALAIISMSGTCLDGLLLAFNWSAHNTHAVQLADGVFTAIFTVIELFPIILVALAIRKRLTAARWLVAIFAFTVEMVSVVRIATEQGRRYTHWTISQTISRPIFHINGNPFTIATILATCLFLAILYAVYRYTVEQGARQAAIEQEFRSAQELQRVLIPETLPQLPGFAVTSAYRPAQEVGGDFFQVLAKPSGAAIILLGDVSGKGLKAAMTVSLIIGAARTLADFYDDPAEILTGLNRRLNGRLQNGFVTALILRVDPDGTCTLANAGHLSPFLNAHELPLPAALPLGLVPSASYETTTLHLAVDDRLTLYTDGLLEARATTGELYGFDRVQTLFATIPSAETSIAAAVSFGQDDDITVLTLTRLPVGVESTTSLHAPTLVTVAA
jgi:hypothetical protein